MNTAPQENFAFIKDLLIPVCVVENREKVYQNKRWEELVTPEWEERILTYNNMMNVTIEGNNYISFILSISPERSLIWLFPADFMEKLQEDVEELKKELEFKDKRFAMMTQNAPIAFLIVKRDTVDILFYNNDLILKICEVDIPFFYSHLNIYKLVKDSEKLRKLISEIGIKQTVSNRETEVTLLNGKTKWWSLNISQVNLEETDTLILAISDITEQKEKEKQLEEYYKEIQAKNQELHLAQEELRTVNERLEETNKTLEESMKYARKVQASVLFPMERIHKVFSSYDVGILFRPHTFVSGDFIWIGEKEEYIYIGVCDATGHGAGGALMAMLGDFVLNEAFKELTSPRELGKMLSRANELFIEKLHLHDVKMNADGFDAALLAFPKKISPLNRTIYYAGAKTPVYIAEKKQIFMHKPATRPIGFVWNYEFQKEFPTNEFELKEDTAVYLFTDGLTDQHGTLLNDEKHDEMKLGRKRVGQVLEKIYDKPGKEQVDIMERVIEQWQKDLPQTDDITFVVIKNKS